MDDVGVGGASRLIALSSRLLPSPPSSLLLSSSNSSPTKHAFPFTHSTNSSLSTSLGTRPACEAVAATLVRLAGGGT